MFLFLFFCFVLSYCIFCFFFFCSFFFFFFFFFQAEDGIRDLYVTGVQTCALPISLGIPCVKPPWGKLTAVDMVHGTIKWQIPLGDTPFIHMNLGMPNLGGPKIGRASCRERV